MTVARPKRRISPTMAPQDRIRLVAQRLFAKHGFEGVSVRMITDKARVNIAAINYYFGTKDQLFVAVVRHHMQAVMRERTERLAALEAEVEKSGKAPSLETIIESWLGPTLALFYQDEDGPAVVRLAMQLNAVVEPEQVTSLLEPYRDYLNRMYRLVARCVPEMTLEQVTWRFECMTGMIFYTIAQPDWQERVPAAYSNIEDEGLMRRRLMESALALFGRSA